MFGCLVAAVVTSSRVIGEIDEIGVPIGGAGSGVLRIADGRSGWYGIIQLEQMKLSPFLRILLMLCILCCVWVLWNLWWHLVHSTGWFLLVKTLLHLGFAHLLWFAGPGLLSISPDRSSKSRMTCFGVLPE